MEEKNFYIVNNIVLSTSYISPIDDIFTLEEELRNKGFEGEIIFDLLLSNGATVNNRYLSIVFDGETLDIANAKVCDEDLIEIMRISDKFYLSHMDLFKAAVFSEKDIKLIEQYKTTHFKYIPCEMCSDKRKMVLYREDMGEIVYTCLECGNEHFKDGTLVEDDG